MVCDRVIKNCCITCAWEGRVKGAQATLTFVFPVSRMFNYTTLKFPTWDFCWNISSPHYLLNLSERNAHKKKLMHPAFLSPTPYYCSIPLHYSPSKNTLVMAVGSTKYFGGGAVHIIHNILLLATRTPLLCSWPPLEEYHPASHLTLCGELIRTSGSFVYLLWADTQEQRLIWCDLGTAPYSRAKVII